MNSSESFFWIPFQSNWCRFAVKATLDLRKSTNSFKFAFCSRKSLNFYNDVRFWITRKSIKRTTNYIITNRKNKDLKKEHLKRKVLIWKRHNFKDSDLWKQFRDEFENWDEAKFFIVNSKILKKFRAFLRRHDIWVMRKRDYSVVKALFEVLQKDIETFWIEEELADRIEKFNSNVIDHLRETDFERNLRDYSWQTKITINITTRIIITRTIIADEIRSIN